jgi:hypothetical protein
MYYFGLDLGQAQDFTALTVGQKIKTKEGEIEYHTRHAERFVLGTTYPDMIDKLEERINAVNIDSDYIVIADATGVGKPVVDLMRKRRIKTVPVVITGGVKELFDPELGGWHVPKRVLVSNLQVLLQAGQLKFAEGMMHAQTLIDELLNFKIKVTTKANDTYEAWREGDHDDLVLSLAMAMWYAARFGTAEDKKAKMNIPNPWLAIKEL